MGSRSPSNEARFLSCVSFIFTESLLSLKKSKLLSMLENPQQSQSYEKDQGGQLDSEFAAFQVQFIFFTDTIHFTHTSV